MLQSILSSKLYRASNRKDRIEAAFLAQGNLSLVTQLAEDLDEEYKKPELIGVEPESTSSVEDSNAESDDLFVDEEINPENDLVTVDDIGNNFSMHSGSIPSHSSPSPDSESSEDKEPDVDTSELMPESPGNEIKSEEPEKEPAEASTKITSSTDVDIAVIKGSLNNVAETAGAIRVAIKNNELWIYYKDDINLNNVMTEVVDYLANSGYDYLEFNRLARSDNAIVFEVIQTTEGEVKTIE